MTTLNIVNGQFDMNSLNERLKWESKIDDFAVRRLGIRHVQTAVMVVSILMQYFLRTTLNVAIVAMAHNETYQTSLAPTFDWDEKIQGVVLSAYLWGYIFMMIPAGILTERFGGHVFLCSSTVIPSLLTLILPQCAYIGGWFLVFINKVVQGLSQAFTYPAVYTLLGVWAPPEERATLSGISLGGGLIGIVAATPLAGFLTANYGWPSVFYWTGGLGTAVGVVMFFLGADNPASHRMISEAEKIYIESSLGGPKMQQGIPWKSILTSVPVSATIFTMACRNMVLSILGTKIPTYIGTVLRFNMEANGVISALPSFVSWLLAFFFSWLCDCATNRGCVGLTTARKVFNSIGLFGSAICLVLLYYTESSATAVLLLTCFFGIQSATLPGVQANIVDVAPNFSGAIFSIATFVSSFLGIFGLVGVGFIVTESGSAEQWGIVFYLSAAILTLSTVVFNIWSTAETQPWNWPDKSKDVETACKEPLIRSELTTSGNLVSYKTFSCK